MGALTFIDIISLLLSHMRVRYCEDVEPILHQ